MLDSFSLKLRRTIGIDGLVSLVAGVLVVFFPDTSIKIVAGLIGASLVLAGIVKMVPILRNQDYSVTDRTKDIIISVVYFVAGLFIFLDMNAASLSLLIVLGVLTGIVWLSEGVIHMTIINRLGEKKVWPFISALISLIAGLSLIVSPFIGGLLVWSFFGIMLLVIGAIKIVQYFTFGK